jgi:hypothetical protein
VSAGTSGPQVWMHLCPVDTRAHRSMPNHNTLRHGVVTVFCLLLYSAISPHQMCMSPSITNANRCAKCTVHAQFSLLRWAAVRAFSNPNPSEVFVA